MASVWTACLCGALLALAYSYVGYPLLVCLLARLRCGEPASDDLDVDRDSLPNVTVLMAAHNAERHISERIDNVFASDYPGNRLRVVVASDGSDDATVDLVRGRGDDRITCLDFKCRRGKAMTLVHAVKQIGWRTHDDVLVFTDVTTRFAADAVFQLAKHFSDPAIGLVTGHVTIIDDEGRPAESLYWKCEMLVRRCEAQLGIMLGASGAIYAMRLPLFVAPKSAVINDDLVIPTLVHLQNRVGIKLDETARAFAVGGSGLAAEFRRRRRIGAGAFQCLPMLSDLFRWRHAKQAIAFISHKLLRWLSPYFLVVAGVSNAFLLDSSVYKFLGLLQASGYALAILGSFLPGNGIAIRIARTATSFVVMNAALAAGFAQWLWHPTNAIWTPTPRANANANYRFVPPPKRTASPITSKRTVPDPFRVGG